MVTVGDVAKYAGVSRSTVSHALSGKRPISRATRERVFEAIEALNFTANAGAKALATSKSSIMGLIVPFTPEEFAPGTMQYVLTVAETARSLGYDVLVVTELEGVAGIARVTDSNQVDGLILLEVKRHDERIGRVLAARQPGVLVGITEDDLVLDSVDLDFTAAGRMLVEHLVERGHRDVIFVTLPQGIFDQDLGFAWRLRDAVIATAAEHGASLTIVYGDPDPVTRSEVVGKALDDHPEATALIVHNEGVLIDLALLLNERGASVPADLSVVSVFPDQFNSMFALPYTAIETSPRAAAARAVQLLAARIQTPDLAPVRELLTPTMVDRGSTRAI